MRSMLRSLWVVVLVLAGASLSRTAHADVADADFKMHVLDPTNPPGGPDYIEGLTFQITFAPCAKGELPGDVTAEGCFLGFNRSGVDWTSLQFTFADNEALHGQPADCSPQGQYDLFHSTSCSLRESYVLNFSDGVIRDGDHFFITEDGVDPTKFGTGDAVVTSYTAATPEPGTLVLLGSGLLLVGLVGMHRIS